MMRLAISLAMLFSWTPSLWCCRPDYVVSLVVLSYVEELVSPSSTWTLPSEMVNGYFRLNGLPPLAGTFICWLQLTKVSESDWRRYHSENRGQS